MSANPSSLSRRDFMRFAGAGLVATSTSGWLDVLARGAAGSNRKACILLWMDGGPSHKDTFDMKPDSTGAGEFKPISTSVPGVQISEHLPKLARQMHHAALLRGMSTGEGAHPRARYFLHTGYREGQGGLVYPALGSIVSAELGKPDFPLPNFVCIGNRSLGSGFLGPRHQPLLVQNPARGVENLHPHVNEKQFHGRLSLLDQLEQGFYRSHKSEIVRSHETTYRRAVQLMESKEARAFDLSQEPASRRQAYGDSPFGEACLLARRLVETGVPFVEVTMGGWDTHQNNFERVKKLCAQVDPAVDALLKDLAGRGLLDSTLVIWMGDFGRTPHINTKGESPGRDHYPRAWTSILFGGGIRGGQVIGRTDKQGAQVEDRPIAAVDFLATVCHLIGVDYTKKNDTPIGRPVRIVDKSAKPIKELTG